MLPIWELGPDCLTLSYCYIYHSFNRFDSQRAATDVNPASNGEVSDGKRSLHDFKDVINMKDFIVDGRTSEYVLFEGDVVPCPPYPPTWSKLNTPV